MNAVGAIVRLEGGNNWKIVYQSFQKNNINSADSKQQFWHPFQATEGPNWEQGLHVNRAFARHVAISLSEDAGQPCIRGQ